MSDMKMPKKTLVPELLPDPKAVRASRVSARDRVIQHARKMIRSGAATGGAVVVGCSCVACDPVPPPSSSFIFDAGAPFCQEPVSPPYVGTATSFGGTLQVELRAEDEPNSPLVLSKPFDVTGGTAALQDSTFIVTPADDETTTVTFATIVTLRDCDGGIRRSDLLVTVTGAITDGGTAPINTSNAQVAVTITAGVGYTGP